jgi:hypothetical protein
LPFAGSLPASGRDKLAIGLPRDPQRLVIATHDVDEGLAVAVERRVQAAVVVVADDNEVEVPVRAVVRLTRDDVLAVRLFDERERFVFVSTPRDVYYHPAVGAKRWVQLHRDGRSRSNEDCSEKRADAEQDRHHWLPHLAVLPSDD